MQQYKVNIPEGTSGIWSVKRFTVTPEDENMERIRSTFSFSSRGRYTPEGEYTKLSRNGHIIMSDTPDEIKDHYSMIIEAKGHILINGLGLGVVLQGCLDKPEVTHATVIEQSQDVINLVGKYYQDKYGDRLTIINEDAFTYKPPKGTKYGSVWHDIWDNICEDNLPEMKTLHRKYGRYAEWQGSWCRYRCEQQR